MRASMSSQMFFALLSSLVIGSVSATVSAAEAEFEIADLHGMWVSTDEALGKPAHSTMAWSNTLSPAIFELRYAIAHTDAGERETIFEGRAIYKSLDDEKFAAVWADSQGDLLPIEAKIDGRTLTANWGNETSSKRGRTEYTLGVDGALMVRDFIWRGEQWVQFSNLEFEKMADRVDNGIRHVTGIGGVFFRGSDPAKLTVWYEQHFEINPPPQSIDHLPWKQDAGYTVFGAFEENTDYFGNPEKKWMINFRVRDLDGLVAKLRAEGVEVTDPEQHPQGRFARLTDPEGNPIELWEPSE